jgi:ABC-2 type transport system permease protein
MSGARALRVFRKDVALGPRSPIFMYALVLPVAMTLILQLVFGTLFEPKPRLGIVDLGDSEITVAAGRLEGVELTLPADADELKRQVEENDLDVGLVLPAGFDEAVRSGARPPLELYMGGESLASNRLILDVTTLDLVRQVEGSAAPVEVRIVDLGEGEVLPISARLVPLILIYALLIAGVFVPASSLVEENEKGTLVAMLVTPARVSEVIVAKAAMGVLLAFLMAVVTLVLNDALGAHPWALIVVVLSASIYSALLGMVLGTVANTTTTMFTIAKASGIFMVGPVIFYLFPEWPQWIARLFPTYWMIDPVWQVAVKGEGLSAVWVELAVTAAICAALGLIVSRLSRRMIERAVM